MNPVGCRVNSKGYREPGNPDGRLGKPATPPATSTASGRVILWIFERFPGIAETSTERQVNDMLRELERII